MTKEDALKVAGGSPTELGRLLGITHNAISQWDDEKIPELRVYQINDIKAARIAAKNKERTHDMG